MSQNDAKYIELLNITRDGEASAEQAEEVRRLLAEHPELRREAAWMELIGESVRHDTGEAVAAADHTVMSASIMESVERLSRESNASTWEQITAGFLTLWRPVAAVGAAAALAVLLITDFGRPVQPPAGKVNRVARAGAPVIVERIETNNVNATVYDAAGENGEIPVKVIWVTEEAKPE